MTNDEMLLNGFDRILRGFGCLIADMPDRRLIGFRKGILS